MLLRSGFRGYDPFEDTESQFAVHVAVTVPRFRGYDPFEDTESREKGNKDRLHQPCFRGYDPFEDTERLGKLLRFLPLFCVSGATIRLRILKEIRLLDFMVPGRVSGATIRLRILKDWNTIP